KRVLFGYDSVAAFQQDVSSSTQLNHVAVPLLCVNTEDDPIVVSIPSIEQVHANPNIILCTTSSGGHLAFYEGKHDQTGIECAATAVKKASGKASTHGSSTERRPLRMWSALVITEFAESVRLQHAENQMMVPKGIETLGGSMGLASSRLAVPVKNKRLLLLALVVLGYHAMPKLKWLFRLLHYKLTAETPQLVYKQTPQNEKLLERCATMTKRKYYPPWYLFNGHLQTVKLSIANEQEKQPVIPYERQILDMPDGGIVSLDWALPPRENGSIPSVREVDPDKRTMIILPGLTGGSGELYIRNTVAQLLDHGWQVVVMNARGCANTPLKTAHLFSSGYTDDLRSTVKYLRAKYNFENEAFVGLGFSMGSNVLVKYLGEEKENAGLTAGISVGNPFDLVICSANFGGNLFNRLTYDKAINGNLKELFFEKARRVILASISQQ
uniref:AB hydrolase-1 domain-containing protein n=1 Tax=Globisporangium ultimum (strain ATCC 200006 / CBS 805.95 / DAOM BR144) TaxID=431595 RepID=K3WXA0_GLOUD